VIGPAEGSDHAGNGNGSNEANEEKVIVRTVIHANQAVVGYLETRGMIWYNDEARRYLIARMAEVGEGSESLMPGAGRV